MSQAWMTLAGLGLDFAGFLLLLREWWIGMFSEHRQMELEQDLERQQRLRQFARQNAPDAMHRHMDVSGRMMDDAAIRRARDERTGAMRTRRRMFLFASVLVVLGFVLQLAGAVPL